MRTIKTKATVANNPASVASEPAILVMSQQWGGTNGAGHIISITPPSYRLTLIGKYRLDNDR